VTVELTGLAIDAADPVALALFWQGVLGGDVSSCHRGEVLTGAGCPELLFRSETRSKVMKNRVHPDLRVGAVAPLLDLGATVIAEYLPEWVTLADPEGNEFCAFLDSTPRSGPAAQLFALCVDSAQPEKLAKWWADRVGARVGPGPDGTPRWLHGCAGWSALTWKFVRVDDARVVPNRWRWRVRGAAGHVGDDGVWRDPQGNEFEPA
jgi:Glyoxalase-like domain